MTILCGTDFSEAARRAHVAAAYLARARRTSVRLVHVLDTPGADAVLAERAEARVTDYFVAEERRLLAQLEGEARDLRSVAPFECEVLAGNPADALVARAEATSAELVVVSAVGQRGERRLRLGHTADQLAQRTRRPVLVVRDEEPFRAWGAGARPLRALVGLDLTPTSDAAVRWSLTLGSAGPCVLTGCHVFWPPEARERFQRRGLPIGPADEEVAHALERELRARVEAITPDIALSIRLVGGLGRVATHLAEVAGEEATDVLVIGTHQREGLERLWKGSVSRDAIVTGTCNVAVVPA